MTTILTKIKDATGYFQQKLMTK